MRIGDSHQDHKGELRRVDEMARIVLDVNETKSGNLPPVCMYCGEAASQSYQVSLGMWPRNVKARLPLCQLHKNHFRLRSLCITIGLPLFALFLIVGIAMGMLSISPSGAGAL